MSQGNVEIVRKLLRAFERRDHELAFRYYDPEIAWDARDVADLVPDLAGVYRGHGEVRTFTFQGGKVVRWKIYVDRRSALEAAGLGERCRVSEPGVHKVANRGAPGGISA